MQMLLITECDRKSSIANEWWDEVTVSYLDNSVYH